MSADRKQKFEEFVAWFDKHITGDEKGEGQIFLERFLQSFGNKGIREVGAVCEDRVKKKTGKTGFADLVWKPRMILELPFYCKLYCCRFAVHVRSIGWNDVTCVSNDEKIARIGLRN